MTTISDALAAYRIFSAAEGKSPRTVRWTETSVGYFSAFLGEQQDVSRISGDDLRRFIIALRERHKFASHPFTRPMEKVKMPKVPLRVVPTFTGKEPRLPTPAFYLSC